MARVLERLLGREKQPEVLDLGSGPAAVYLADRGARVSVEGFDPPDAPDPAREDPAKPILILQPDARFDLVVAWESGDFVHPDRLGEFAAELRRVLVPGGWLLYYAQDRAGERSWPDRPGAFRLTADDRMVRIASAGPMRDRWNHPNRAIERALAPLAIQAIHLQRNRVREILAQKPAGRSGTVAGSACPPDRG
jgi:SAM-dependent methyltransferase